MKISAKTFIDHNPLFKVSKINGNNTMSYKSTSVEYFWTCEGKGSEKNSKCGEFAERKGSSKFNCLRCRRYLVQVSEADGYWKVEEPTDEKELELRTRGFARPAKSDTTIPTPRLTISKKTVKVSEEDEDEDEEEEEAPAPKIISLDIDKLVNIASKTSGLRTKVASKKEALVAKREDERKHKAKQVEDADADINEPDEEDIPQVVLPVTKKKEQSKAKPQSVKVEEKGDCAKVEEITMKVVRLKANQTFFCPVTNTMYMGVTE